MAPNQRKMAEIAKTHLGVYGVLVSAGKVLMIKKARGPYVGKLDLPGGKLKHGESLQEGLARELLEETGVILHSVQLLTNLTTRVSFEDERGLINMYQVGLIYRIDDADLTNLQENINFKDSLGTVWVDFTSANLDELAPFAQEAVKILNR